jgi:hypothetical protein
MAQMTGGCLCGKIRYTISADPIFTGVCHCTNCQKQGGSSFSIVVGVPAAALSVTGTMKTYQDKGDSGKAVGRLFCPDCGSPIQSDVEAMPGIAIIKAGTLDDTSSLKPGMQIFCDSAQPWVQLGGDMKRFAKMPG